MPTNQNEQVPCRHCGHYFQRRGLVSHERSCSLNTSTPTPTGSPALSEYSVSSTVSESFSVNGAFRNPCKWCGQVALLYIAAFVLLQVSHVLFWTGVTRVFGGNPLDALEFGLTEYHVVTQRSKRKASSRVKGIKNVTPIDDEETDDSEN